MRTAFDRAEYYDCRDGTELVHTSPEEAIETHVDDMWNTEMTLKQNVSALAPIRVTAYSTKEIDYALAADLAQRTYNDLEDKFEDRYGDPDGVRSAWSSEEALEIISELNGVLNRALRDADVWQCEEIAWREYSEDEILEIMKDYL